MAKRKNETQSRLKKRIAKLEAKLQKAPKKKVQELEEEISRCSKKLEQLEKAQQKRVAMKQAQPLQLVDEPWDDGTGPERDEIYYPPPVIIPRPTLPEMPWWAYAGHEEEVDFLGGYKREYPMPA